MKWILLGSLLVVGIGLACGGKMIIPPPEEDQDYEDIPGVESEVDTGNEEEVVGGDSDNPDGDNETPADGDGDSDTVDNGSGDNGVGGDSDETVSDDDEVECTESCPIPEENDCDKVLVCHNGHEICIDENAVDAHLRKGDTLGNCE